jgi:hypothetical protein
MELMRHSTPEMTLGTYARQSAVKRGTPEIRSLYW